MFNNDVFFLGIEICNLSRISHGNAWMDPGVTLGKLGLAPIIVKEVMQEATPSRTFGIPTKFFSQFITGIANMNGMLQAIGMNMVGNVS